MQFTWGGGEWCSWLETGKVAPEKTDRLKTCGGYGQPGGLSFSLMASRSMEKRPFWKIRGKTDRRSGSVTVEIWQLILMGRLDTMGSRGGIKKQLTLRKSRGVMVGQMRGQKEVRSATGRKQRSGGGTPRNRDEGYGSFETSVPVSQGSLKKR